MKSTDVLCPRDVTPAHGSTLDVHVLTPAQAAVLYANL